MKRTMRITAVFVALAVWVLATASVPAEGQPRDADTARAVKRAAEAASSTATPVKRELVFREREVHEESEGLYYPTGDLPPQRYAALFSMTLKYPPVEVFALVKPVKAGGFRNCPKEILPMLEAARATSGYENTIEPPDHPLEVLVDNVPKALRPPATILGELLDHRNPWAPTFSWKMKTRTEQAREDARRNATRKNQADNQAAPARLQFSLSVLAADPQRLKELVRTLIVIFDEGFSRKCHEDYVAAEKKIRTQIDEYPKVVKDAEEQLAAYEDEFEQLSAFQDLSTEALASLTAQKRMIAVNVIGIRARFDACGTILAEREKLSTSRIDQVETVKITAEIELVGLAAEQKAIDGVITAGRRRAELQTKIPAARHNIERKQKVLALTEDVLAEYQKAVAEGWAYAEISEISIRPIRWEPYSRQEN